MNMLYAKELGINPDDMMAVMATESGFETGYSKFNNGAVGLAQFTSAPTTALGVTLDQLAVMNPIEQLGYVYKMWSLNKGKVSDVYDLYALNFAPYSKAIGNPDMYVKIYGEGSSGYENNKALDRDSDKKLTKHDLKVQMDLMVGNYRTPKRP